MLDTKQHSYSLSVAFGMKRLCKRQLSNMSRCFVCITFKSRTPFLMSVCLWVQPTHKSSIHVHVKSHHYVMPKCTETINSVKGDLRDHVTYMNYSDAQKSRFLSRLRKFHKLQKFQSQTLPNRSDGCQEVVYSVHFHLTNFSSRCFCPRISSKHFKCLLPYRCY